MHKTIYHTLEMLGMIWFCLFALAGICQGVVRIISPPGPHGEYVLYRSDDGVTISEDEKLNVITVINYTLNNVLRSRDGEYAYKNPDMKIAMFASIFDVKYNDPRATSLVTELQELYIKECLPNDKWYIKCKISNVNFGVDFLMTDHNNEKTVRADAFKPGYAGVAQQRENIFVRDENGFLIML